MPSLLPTISPRKLYIVTWLKYIAPVRRQKVDAGPVVLLKAPAVHVKRLPVVERETTSEVKCDCRRYRGIVEDNAGQPADVLADKAGDLDDILA